MARRAPEGVGPEYGIPAKPSTPAGSRPPRAAVTADHDGVKLERLVLAGETAASPEGEPATGSDAQPKGAAVGRGAGDEGSRLEPGRDVEPLPRLRPVQRADLVDVGPCPPGSAQPAGRSGWRRRARVRDRRRPPRRVRRAARSGTAPLPSFRAPPDRRTGAPGVAMHPWRRHSTPCETGGLGLRRRSRALL